MGLVVHSSFQIHCFVSYLFSFSMILPKNRMIQIVLCVPLLTLFDMGGGGGGGMMATQNVFDYCAQKLRRRTPKLGDF